MARPKKQTVEYFPHFVLSGKTIFILESCFGNDGYAFWFKLLELLGATDGHVYNCRNTAEWEFLLAKTHVSNDIACRILQKLADLDAIDSELWEEELIWSDNFVKNLLPLYSNRKSSLPQKPISTSRNPISGELLLVETPHREITTAENTQSKVEESKVKESKVEEIVITAATEENPDYKKVIDYYLDKINQNMESANDIQTAKELMEDGIPIDLIFRCIDHKVKSYKPKHPEDKIRALKFFEGYIRDRWEVEKVVIVDGPDKSNTRESEDTGLCPGENC